LVVFIFYNSALVIPR